MLVDKKRKLLSVRLSSMVWFSVHGVLLLFLLLESVGVPASSQCSVHVHVTISTDSYAKIRQRRRRQAGGGWRLLGEQRTDVKDTCNLRNWKKSGAKKSTINTQHSPATYYEKRVIIDSGS